MQGCDILISISDTRGDEIEVAISVIVAKGQITRLKALEAGARIDETVLQIIAIDVRASLAGSTDTGDDHVEVSVPVDVTEGQVAIVQPLHAIVTLCEASVANVCPNSRMRELDTAFYVRALSSVNEVEITIEIDVSPVDGGCVQVWQAQRGCKDQRVIRGDGNRVEKVGAVALGDAA